MSGQKAAVVVQRSTSGYLVETENILALTAAGVSAPSVLPAYEALTWAVQAVSSTTRREKAGCARSQDARGILPHGAGSVRSHERISQGSSKNSP